MANACWTAQSESVSMTDKGQRPSGYCGSSGSDTYPSMRASPTDLDERRYPAVIHHLRASTTLNAEAPETRDSHGAEAHHPLVLRVLF